MAERSALSPRGLRYLENGTRVPYPDTVRRLIAALELSENDAAELIAAARAHRRRVGLAPAPPPAHGDIIGREAEVAEAVELLRQPCRLLTVTGPGGVGKTRFAIELADALGVDFSDGVAWVPLAGVAVPDEVAPAILRGLAGAEASSRNEPEAVLARLQNAGLLLVLDNFEHVAKAAHLVARVVAGCPGVSVLVTSRAPLRVGMEQEFWLGPLPLPSSESPATPETVQLSPAVQLFSERARAVDRHFSLDAANAADVVQVCRRLEGLPLALELAAARVRVLSLPDLLAQLSHRFDLLTSGAVDAPPRHRSLRSTLDWSYELLDHDSQRLLLALSVFAGGCTFAAIRSICASPDEPAFNIVDTIDALQRSSLLQRVDPVGGDARYTLLETVREYGREHLEATPGEGHLLRRRHADYFAELGVEAAARLEGPGQAAAATQLEDEHDNIRAALQWMVECDPEAALRLAGQLWMFWYMRGYSGEGRRYLSAALERASPVPVRVTRAKALLGAGQLARAQGDFASARSLMSESTAAYQALGDSGGLAFALFGTGFVARMQEDYEGAQRSFEDALRLARETGNGYAVALTLHHLGLGALEVEGDLPRARALLEESLSLFRAVGFPRHVALVLSTLGNVARCEGRFDDARRLHIEALLLLLESGQQADLHWVLEGFADLAASEGKLEHSVRILAAAHRLRDSIGDPEWGPVRRRREGSLAAARETLGHPGYDAAWKSGAGLAADDAAALALDGPPPV